MGQFIGLENMRTVLTALEQRVNDSDYRIAQAIESGSVPVRQVVYEVMVDMAQDEAYTGLSTSAMNEFAVDTVTRFYEQLSEDRENARRTQQSLPAPEQREPDPEPRPMAPFNTTSANTGSVPGIENPLFDQRPATTIVRCISIDGQDRVNSSYPERFRFAYDLAEPVRAVTAVKTCTVVLPAAYNMINCQYLLLVVEELPSAYAFNSAAPVRRAFSKLVPKSQYKATSEGSIPAREYAVLEPIANDKRTFDPPIPSLSRFTVSLLRPDGDLVSFSRDRFIVQSVAPAGEASKYDESTFNLTLSPTIVANDFSKGDIVVFSHFASVHSAFNNFMNRSKGHVVKSTGMETEGASNVAGYANSIIIARSFEINEAGEWTGDKQVNEAFREQLEVRDDGVRVINVSLQMSVTLEVECAHSGISNARAV